ncbi:MAG: LytR family transcriptional regulator, partial [Pseudonocardia sp.]|nr:LytR family transcriptional regulator [Pseudonocardia sp.]
MTDPGPPSGGSSPLRLGGFVLLGIAAVAAVVGLVSLAGGGDNAKATTPSVNAAPTPAPGATVPPVPAVPPSAPAGQQPAPALPPPPGRQPAPGAPPVPGSPPA